MEYRELGKTGLKISFLGLGGIPLQRISQEEANRVIDRCLALGINFIDTGRGYTDSEVKIGQALKGRRQQVVLATKSMAKSQEAMAKDIELSLANLQTDYIDLYQCHNIRTAEEEAQVFGSGGAMEALLAAKKAGKIGHIGVTGHQVQRLLSLLQRSVFETVQAPYNFNEDQVTQVLLPLAQKQNLGFIVMKPLGGGALPAEYAMRFFLDKPVSVIIPGMDCLSNVEENCRYIESGQILSPEEGEIIQKFREETGSQYCRRCDYCRPCPQGIDISNLFLFHGYFSRYNMQEWGLSRYNSLAIKPDACVGCGLCESRCPYELPIRRMLKAVYRDMNGK